MRRLIVLAAVLTSLSGAAWGQTTPTQGFLREAQIGFDGTIPDRGLVPVWVTLENRTERAESLQLIARTHNAQQTRDVSLLAGSRRRVCLGLVIRRNRLLVEVRRAGELVEQRLFKSLKTVDTKRLLLCVDGRRDGQLPASRAQNSTLPYLMIPPRALPTEAGCLGGFGAILLRDLDPDGWSADQRAALIEFVAQGGTLMVAGVRAQFPDAVAFVDGLPVGTGITEKRLGRPVRLFGLGLGRVLAFPDDPLEAALGGAPGAAQLKQEFGELVQGGAGQAAVAHLYQGSVGVSGPELPGLGVKVLLGIFVVGYLLALGPILGITLRKATRRRLAQVTLALIVGFSVLAFVIAGLVRSSDGRAFVREVIVVSPSGPSVLLADVTVVSGGSTGYSLRLEGPSMGVTLLPANARRTQRWSHSTQVWERFEPDTVRSLRGQEIDVATVMPPWGRQSLAAVALLPDVQPLDASLTRSARGYEVTIRNNTGSTLRRVTILEESNTLETFAPYVSVGDLEPGQVRKVPVKRGAAARRRIGGALDFENTWYRALDVPPSWNAWTLLDPQVRASVRSALRYRIVSRPDPRVRASGESLDSVSHALRLDPVRVKGGMEKGYLGLTVEPGATYSYGNGQTHREVNVAAVVPLGPAARAGMTKGIVINSANGQQVTSVSQFRRLTSRYLPGEKVKLQCWDPTTGNQRTITLTLVRKDQLKPQ